MFDSHFRIRVPLLMLALGCMAAPAAWALSDFGSVPVATATPPTLKLTFTLATAGTAANPPYQVLTQGAPNLDYTAAATQAADACKGGHFYFASQTCSVTVQFKPLYAGQRLGAVMLRGISGMAYLQGIGDGPQAAFDAPLPASAITALGGGFNSVYGVAVDGAGNVYTTDITGYVVKKIPPGCTTAACTVTLGSGFASPTGVAVDGAGNVYVSASMNHSVNKITVTGGCTTTCAVTQLGGGFNYPQGVAVDGAGNVYVADKLNNAVKKITVTGGCTTNCTVTTLPGSYSYPVGVAVDGAGNVFVADIRNSAVKMISAASGTVTTLAGGFAPSAVTVDGAGNVYVADYTNNVVKKIAAVGGAVTTLASGFKRPNGVAVDGAGNVYAGDNLNNVVKKIDRVTPLSLAFASTSIGSISADSPQTVTLANIGTQPLNFAIPSGSASNPAISTNFGWDSTTASSCPSLTSASSAASLASGAACDFPVSFAPMTAGNPLNGTLVLTDDSLNVLGSTQTIPLQGSATIAPTTTTLVVTPASPTYGDSVTLTATITVTGNVTPTGTVQFTDGAGGPVIGSCSAVALSAASPWQATCTTAALAVGAHTAVAVYSGDPATTTSNGSTSLTINQDGQTIAFDSTPPGNPTVGGNYTVAATATSGLTVTFSIDAASTSGACSIAGSMVSFTGAGTCIIDANQGGDTTYAAAPQAQQPVGIKAGTSTTLTTQCMRMFVQAEPFTMMATVTGASPTGNVGFSDGSATLSCGGATPSAPTASCTTTALNVPGTYQLTATYDGDGNNNGSTSNALPVTVLSAADVVFRNGYEVDSADCPIQ